MIEVIELNKSLKNTISLKVGVTIIIILAVLYLWIYYQW
jgi:hypothetical protein